MKRIKPSNTAHTSLNDELKAFLRKCDNVGVSFSFKLKDRLDERKLSANQFSQISGLRVATISDLCTGRKGSLSLHHLLLIMMFLRTTDIKDIIDIEFPSNVVEGFKEQRLIWMYKGDIPLDINSFLESMLSKK